MFLGVSTNDTNQQRESFTSGLDTLHVPQDATQTVSRDNYAQVPGSSMQPVTLCSSTKELSGFKGVASNTA
eukprot:139957-Amphidinium_carterae.3